MGQNKKVQHFITLMFQFSLAQVMNKPTREASKKYLPLMI